MSINSENEAVWKMDPISDGEVRVISKHVWRQRFQSGRNVWFSASQCFFATILPWRNIWKTRWNNFLLTSTWRSTTLARVRALWVSFWLHYSAEKMHLYQIIVMNDFNISIFSLRFKKPRAGCFSFVLCMWKENRVPKF